MEGLGKKVAYFRKSKGLSIKALAENLCDDSTIYRLEQGKQLPRLEILNDICLKLEIPFKALFPLNEVVEELKSLCREFTYTNDYLSLELTLDKCNVVLEGVSSIYLKEEFRKFIQWHRAILLHKKENKAHDALSILNELVSLKSCGSELDISILNSTGLIYLSTNNVEDAHKIYIAINERIEQQRIIEDFTLFPRVRYNYAYSLFKLNYFDKALTVSYEILHYLETHQLIYSLGKVYHMIGLLLKSEGNLTDAEEAFNNAILVFTLTKDQQNLTRAKTDLSSLHANF
ncbi:helix-turn-helix domain-containing protein [Psychrobacillus sp. NPDC096623]|uniref:helix-turn-helix domain-containing protein n=1 Tax=Psychrobacillus sp. NPDC096623 TaxID=3364492 RepID=UPI003802A010